MPTEMEIQAKCGKVANRLRYARGDEIVLLRTARALAAVHRSLAWAARDRVPPIDRTDEGVHVASLLATAESGLRRVLLASPSLSAEDMYESLEDAACAMLSALELLTDTLPAAHPTGARPGTLRFTEGRA